MDVEKVCRLCLETQNLTHDIFTYIYKKANYTYCEMLTNCTKLRPNEEDGLPRLICKECCKQLKKTYNFNIQCEESDRKLKLLLSTKEQNSEEFKSENIYEIKDEEVKSENEKEDYSTKDNDQNLLISILGEEDVKSLKENIKLEPSGDDDSCWDADDDSILLDVKLKKLTDEHSTEHEPKKSRGRRKKGSRRAAAVPESKLPHQCDVCGKFLSTKSNLKAHKICHTDLRPYKCTDCDASFRGHSALFQHKKVHTGETPYHCEYCPKQFRRRTGLVNHIRMHTGEKMFRCEICMKTFVQSAQLSIHMKRHKGDKPFLCQDCGKGFSIKADLKVHQRIHNGEKPYACHLCAKTFATSGNLSIHVRIHNKEIRYKCKECHRGFVTCSAFNVHVKRHRGQRDHRCECGKSFYTSSALKQHRVVHTGEKKYQCKICERKFTQTSHLSRHFKRDHAKPNVPLPSSDHYKLVLQDGGYKNVFATVSLEKVSNREVIDAGVKCEDS